jgi:hypothetical protein
MSAQHFATERAILPPAKQESLDSQATLVAKVALTPPKPPPTRDPQSVPSTATRLMGISDSQINPFRLKHPAQNSWFGDYNGEPIAVYAGSLYNDLTQGVVGVATGPAGDIAKDVYTEYPTPKRAGAVRIVSVSGTRLTLQTDDGTQFVFDYVTRAFI